MTSIKYFNFNSIQFSLLRIFSLIQMADWLSFGIGNNMRKISNLLWIEFDTEYLIFLVYNYNRCTNTKILLYCFEIFFIVVLARFWYYLHSNISLTSEIFVYIEITWFLYIQITIIIKRMNKIKELFQWVFHWLAHFAVCVFHPFDLFWLQMLYKWHNKWLFFV